MRTVLPLLVVALLAHSAHAVANQQPPTVFSHFAAKNESYDFLDPPGGLHILRFDLDVTGDGRAEVFLGLGPVGRAGTVWTIYSPDEASRYHMLGELFFHPGASCYDATSSLFSFSQRIETHEHVVASYRITKNGIAWVRSSRRVSDLEEPFPKELADLGTPTCPTPKVLMAPTDLAAKGLPAWKDLYTRESVDPQPLSLNQLILFKGTK